jgi:hypothetical protein
MGSYPERYNAMDYFTARSRRPCAPDRARVYASALVRSTSSL